MLTFDEAKMELKQIKALYYDTNPVIILDVTDDEETFYDEEIGRINNLVVTDDEIRFNDGLGQIFTSEHSFIIKMFECTSIIDDVSD